MNLERPAVRHRSPIRSNDKGNSPLEVMIGLLIMSFTGAMIILGARAMNSAGATTVLNHQMDSGRQAMEVVMSELADAGPAGGICVDPGPNVPVGACRTSRSVPFSLVSGRADQVCFYGRAESGQTGPEINPDRVCLTLDAASGLFFTKRWEGTGTWTTPSYDDGNEIQNDVLSNLDGSASRFRYYDSTGVELSVPLSAEQLTEVVLVEASFVFAGISSKGEQSVEIVFVAPLRANTFAAGD